MTQRITLVGMVRVTLPDHVLRLCDGGFVPWDGETFEAVDPVFGTIAGLEAIEEGVGNEVPAGTITFYPPSIAAAIDLSRPGYQGSRIEMWVAEIDEATGQIVGAPDRMADWQTDKTVLKRTSHARALEMLCVTRSQRLMAINDGNAMSTAAHQRVYPGERGHDNAVGMEIDVAWGVASPPRGVQPA